MANAGAVVAIKPPRICKKGGEGAGLMFPAGGDWEAEMSEGVKAVMYGVALGWCFLGVAMIADTFMSSIEAITSKKRRIFDKRTKRHRTIKVWNETVANLTLMALGSSAPEILLNCIEVGKNEMFAGELGPGTIVGSAAFNLLCITAVCVYSIPDDEVRQIKDVPVYVVTALFSLFAYIWMLVILMAITPDVITVWEAVVTLLFFPVLVIISFAADKGWIGGVPAMANRRRVVAAEMTLEEQAELAAEIRKEFGDLDEETMQLLMEKRTAARPSKAVYRAERARKNFAARNSNSASNNKINNNNTMTAAWTNAMKSDAEIVGANNYKNKKASSTLSVFPEGQATIEIATSAYAVKESSHHVEVEVRRYDDLKATVKCRFRTVEGTAEKGKDYEHKEGVLVFEPGVQAKKIEVRIVDDDAWEKAEDFYVEIFDESTTTGSVKIGPNAKTTVTIIDDDDPGVIAFAEDTVSFLEEIQHGELETLKVKVCRHNGSKGEISCQCKSEADSAIPDFDFVPVNEELLLKNGEMETFVPVKIKRRGRCEAVERFRLILTEPKGCRFDKNKGDGDEDQQICTIEIKAHQQHQEAIKNVSLKMMEQYQKSKLGYGNWQEQFIAAVYAGGSKEDQAEASILDWVHHIVSLPFKLAFALVPPTDFLGGWACFVVALIFVGIITAMVGDLASLFGCCLGMPGEITAITFVALGTSLPDTFASRSAAMQDPYADACITNITGSNSVNVFLGLGLPWTIATIYWQSSGPTAEWRLKIPADVQSDWYPDAQYVLIADSLGFSVGVFTATAVTAIAALWIRRRLYGGELGGPYVPKVATSIFLTCLWAGYIAASWIYKEVNDPS